MGRAATIASGSPVGTPVGMPAPAQDSRGTAPASWQALPRSRRSAVGPTGLALCGTHELEQRNAFHVQLIANKEQDMTCASFEQIA
jgi:hypothetical protein